MDITIYSKKGLHINGQWIECETKRQTDGVARVRVKDTITIPANSEIKIAGKGENRKFLSTRYSIVEPVVEDELHPVVDITEVSNMEEQQIRSDGKIHDKVIVPESWVQNTDHVRKITGENCQDTQMNKADVQMLPEFLHDLYERSIKDLTEEHREKLRQRLITNKDAFAAYKTHLGTCSYIKHSIETAGAAPVRQPLRRTPTTFEREEEKNLKDQLKQDVIRPSTSPWASNVVLVRKKDQTVRWCCDFRRLNELTVKCAYAVPRIDMCIDCLSSASIFSCIDLQSGYWQLKVEEKDIPKTVFISKYGLFEYTKMPFGLCNAPVTFQCCIELILRSLQWQTVLIYLEDVIIYSSNIDEHFKHLNEVLTRLKNAGLKLKPSKCDLIKEEILYLGHIVGQHGVKPNPKIIERVQYWKTPSNTKETQQFLGFFRPGTKHNNTDTMSRLDYNDQLCEHQQKEEFNQDCKCCTSNE
ncbi:Transposon Ty3-I Gag-Pol polyprotein,Transposon Ty3-G Gag-Pol polyprotein [Mytilus coruscus]|uniref:Transposon Ty3-I Gag-Pol polyprotein,Transposon Ty3-G Gag-Pol polyprotein n=1 Tax=Mytilus coruscus TaxID=42192 RepID=A0A6J8DPK5_MYTCO|nr:Transposon Ty3-I Gag-Pol polyprotein,Transposon Ty3-G Gag-Pol polyprotein [Mytilus coruscus]